MTVTETQRPTTSSTRRGPRWWRAGATRGAVVGWLVALIAAASGAAVLWDNSFLTHITTGRLILDGTFPRADPYSFTAHGEPWVVQSWLASLLYALTDKIGHGAGTRLMISVLSATLAAILWRLTRPTRSIVARLAAVAPALIVGIVAWGHRPLLFGLLGFAFVLLTLREERDPRWLVPVMWVWVNTHGSFPLGGVLVVIYGFGVWCDKGSFGHVLRTLKWLVIGIIVGAVNPIGPKLLWFPVELLQKQDVLSNMVEWQAPEFTDLWQRIFLAAVVVAVALIPRIDAGDGYRVLLPALVFTALGFTAARNIALASIVLTPLLAVGLAGLGSLTSSARSRTYTVASAVLVALTVLIVAMRLGEPSYRFTQYPVGAIDWLESRGELNSSSRIAAADLVGNYLEFRTEGEVPVFIDDRVDMYPESVVMNQRVLLNGLPGWSAILNHWDIETVVWEQGQPLAALLTESPQWHLARTWTDPDSYKSWVVFERVSPSDA